MDRDNSDPKTYVLKWLAEESDGSRAKATAIGLHGQRHRELLKALHGVSSLSETSRHRGDESLEDRGEAGSLVVVPPGPLDSSK